MKSLPLGVVPDVLGELPETMQAVVIRKEREGEPGVAMKVSMVPRAMLLSGSARVGRRGAGCSRVADPGSERPRMAVASRNRVFIRDARIGGDGSVQEIVRISCQQLGDVAGQHLERAQNRLAEEYVRSRRPRVSVAGNED